MAIMTLAYWKKQTARRCVNRSKELKAIDTALEAYHTSKGTKTQVELTKAVEAWLKSKGNNWKASTRNSKIEPEGKGTVEVLIDQIIATAPMVASTFAPYTAKPKQPVGQVLANGALTQQKDLDGNWHTIPVQIKENSCGPCSMRLVIKLVTNQDVSEEYLRELVEIAEEGGAYSGTLGSGGVLESGNAHDWSPTGGGTWLVPAALKNVKPAIKATHYGYLSPLLQTTRSKPAIAVVAWTGGGLHYVVVAGPLRKDPTRMLILDPFYGAQSVGFTTTTIDNYEPIDHTSKAVLAEATWYDWVCKVE
jgi:hypothetical protein